MKIIYLQSGPDDYASLIHEYSDLHKEVESEDRRKALSILRAQIRESFYKLHGLTPCRSFPISEICSLNNLNEIALSNGPVRKALKNGNYYSDSSGVPLAVAIEVCWKDYAPKFLEWFCKTYEVQQLFYEPLYHKPQEWTGILLKRTDEAKKVHDHPVKICDKLEGMGDHSFMME